MITFETGVPGAGKTLYCVDKLLRPMVGATVKHEAADGSIVDVPRTIYTNINGLLLEHEKIGVEELNTWHEWAKPGAVIVFDEVQKPWPLAPSGSKAPSCITALETHRHMGVDFILLSQHPMLVHGNVMRLVGRHLHIRRMGNMGLAVVYEWDSVSKTLLYKNALSKGAYRYDKSVFQLYKSAELHTKQPRRIPSLVYGVLAGLVGLAFLGPTAYSRVQERINPTPATSLVAATAKTEGVKHAPGVQEPYRPRYPVRAASDAPGVVAVAAPVVAGCMAAADRCTCFDAKGVVLPEVKPEVCSATSGAGGAPVINIGPDTVRPVDLVQASGDTDTLAWMAAQRHKR